jgi:transcriptional regulator with XRE-family HTH domain
VNTSSYGRVVSSALLTRTLKRLRHASGQQHKQVAEALEWSISKLIRIESSSAQISRTDLETLLRYYGVTGQEQVDELTVWAQESRLPGWWESFRIQDEAFERYVAYEAAAASIRMAQELLVPGILQTEEYARLISSTYSSPDDVDSVVRLRLARQEAVFARKPEQHHILDEAVLRRRVGDTMPGQLRHLAELAARPEIIIRVIPFGAGPHFGMKGPFVLLGFDVPLGNILFLESGRRSDLIICEEETYPDQILPGVSEAAEAIAAFEDGFSELNRIALDESDSTALIEQIGRESALLFPRYLGSIGNEVLDSSSRLHADLLKEAEILS